MKTLRIAGVMSGTSADGLDVAVLTITPSFRWRLESFHHTAFSPRERATILSVASGHATTPVLARLHVALGRRIAQAVLRARPGRLDAVASHGQTVYHEGRRVTLQLGDPASIAALTGVPVISDFRAADIAQGGEGAPLVPWADAWLFGHPGRYRAVLNLGGIANLTLLPPGRDPSRIRGFDTGPANMPLDALMQHLSAGRRAFDKDGAFAARGMVHLGLLAALRSDPFFRRHPPKSCGREQFGLPFVLSVLRDWSHLSPVDVMATLVALVAETISSALPASVTELIVAGGGTHNRTLMRALSAACPRQRLVSSASLGVPSQAREAMAFALLGAAHLRSLPANLPAVTAARRSVILGSYTPAPK